MSRCKRVVGTAECGLPVGNHWPHRYIERNPIERCGHEWRLWRHGYTTFGQFLLALTGRAR